jgi:RNA polymerase sigma-70 factor (ECF subfamily)
VEDLVQETFLRAYDRLDTFNPEYRFKTWLLAIANNLGIDTLRRRRDIVEFNPELHAPRPADPRRPPSSPSGPGASGTRC